MSTIDGGWRGPNIVKDGLVLYLDAGSPNSYYGGVGTVWKDMSGNGNNGTLTNGPTFNSSNGGSIVLDGVDDYVNITQNTLYRFVNTQPFSLSVWVRCTSTSGFVSLIAYSLAGDNRGYYLSIDLNVLRTNSFLFDYYDGNAFRGIQGTNNSVTINSWINLVATSSSNSVNDMKVYQNGLLTSFTNRGTGTPNTINYNSLSLQIGARGSSGYFKGNISQTLIYNRALTSQEVSQNFNATRARFGI